MVIFLTVTAGVIFFNNAYASPAMSDKPVQNKLSSLEGKFSYDKAGRIGSFSDPGGKKTVFAYELDKTGSFLRKATKKYADKTKVIYEYDHLERRKKMSDPSGTLKYKYDNYDRKTVETIWKRGNEGGSAGGRVSLF